MFVCVEIFHESAGQVKYIPTKNNEHDLHRRSQQTCSCFYAILLLIYY